MKDTLGEAAALLANVHQTGHFSITMPIQAPYLASLCCEQHRGVYIQDIGEQNPTEGVHKKISMYGPASFKEGRNCKFLSAKEKGLSCWNKNGGAQDERSVPVATCPVACPSRYLGYITAQSCKAEHDHREVRPWT